MAPRTVHTDDHTYHALLALCGTTIRFYRDQCGLTLVQLSQRSGVSKSQIARLEAGKGTVSLLYFLQIAGALGVPPHALLPTASPEHQPLTPEQLCLLADHLPGPAFRIVYLLMGLLADPRLPAGGVSGVVPAEGALGKAVEAICAHLAVLPESLVKDLFRFAVLMAMRPLASSGMPPGHPGAGEATERGRDAHWSGHR